MRAFIVDAYGKDARLRAGDRPEPAVGDRDVLVRVEAAGVNPLDAKILAGEFRRILPYRTPFVLGNDVAGVVERVGPAVRRFRPGDRVYARPDEGRIGTFAELVAVDEADLARTPAGLTAEEAASLPLVALTAWQALVERADVRPGQKVLVHAGSGGLGSVAIQLAKHLGAHVATTASTANVDRVRDLGADQVIDYRTTDFETALSGFDVVLDSLGPDNLAKSLRVLRPGGLAISVAGPPDPAFARRLGKPLLRPVMAVLSWKVRRAARRLGVRYSFLFMRADGAQLQEITSLVEAGVLRPVVDRVFGFDDTPAALDLVGSGRARGKVVVSMAPVTRTPTSQTPTRGEQS
ncbi:NADP-dependent oxidoreductase [Pseudonocardia broussonetiae]|uniref:NADP-dependent oxidoreductase n=1 Tax=Pseudonocardia broussonetiae TaxID=2736640 RepID=A0A6M6JMN7_9PSEU|nr:NADP-dependent oxidoreductase [Pseudonocardia broussonetiae]QJY49344.1 NADP-dependent oxidoreductase [Pseudonocardia broussonetiae]